MLPKKLTITSLSKLTDASYHIARGLHISGFWRKQIARDMPWVERDIKAWERSQTPAELEKVDWKPLYFAWKRKGEQGKAEAVRGLVNRRRLWEVAAFLGIMAQG